jgi:signal transduction histidine kinase
MKLVLRLALAMTIGMCAVFAIDRYFLVVQSAAMFETDIKRDQHILGRALALAVSSIWQTHGKEAALRFLDHANQREAKTQIEWVALGPEVLGRKRSALNPRVVEVLRTGMEATRFEPSQGDFGRLHTFVPVTVNGVHLGAIELAESLAEERAFLRSRVLRAFVAAGLMALVSALLAIAVGVQFVGRPIQSLIEKARRIGAGDFSKPLQLRQRDELSELANAMNTMAHQLTQAHERVDTEVRERIAALEQLRHAERLSTVGRIASGVAHELGTPLNVVSGRAKMIESGEVSGPEVAANARIIGEQVERMAAIIRQLLSFARRRSPVRTRADMRVILRDMLELLKPMAVAADVELTFEERHAADQPVELDVEQIRQLLANLVMNGIQASPRGGRVHVTLARVSTEGNDGATSGPYWRLDVEDQGSGIPADVLPHVFEPFFTTKPVGQGTGLGLSVTQGIVGDHRGWIEVHSVPGEGARFTVFLPA